MSVEALEINVGGGRKWPILNVIRTWLEVFAAARECGAAVEMGERPSDRALKVLGIDPSQFAKVQLR